MFRDAKSSGLLTVYNSGKLHVLKKEKSQVLQNDLISISLVVSSWINMQLVYVTSFNMECILFIFFFNVQTPANRIYAQR